MPITKSAKKALKKSLKRKERNLVKKQQIKKARKEFNKLLAEAKLEEAKKQLDTLYRLIDKAAKTNLIKKNKASRDKSQLAKKLRSQIKQKRLLGGVFKLNQILCYN